MNGNHKTRDRPAIELMKRRQRITGREALEIEPERVERAIQETLEYAESIVATVRQPLLVLDANLRVVSANRPFYQTFKVTPEKTVGWFLYELDHCQWDIPSLRELLKDILAKNAILEDYELEHDFQTLGHKTMLLNARRVHREASKTQMLILTIEDITERKQMQQRLLDSERLATVGQFSGSISHELRNPLGVIDSSAYYLKRRLEDSDRKVQEHLDRIQASVRSAATIIDSLLNLTRTSGPQMRKLSLAVITSKAIADAKLPAGIRVVKRFPEQQVWVTADQELLQIAFKNIVGNAVEAMNGQGTLTATVSVPANGQTEVSFADTGPGIAAENRDKIFQPFFTTKATGIGFGLSIAKTIVNKHGGSLEVRSEPGKGATFSIQLSPYRSNDEET